MSVMLPSAPPPPPGTRGPSFDLVRCNKAERYCVDFISLSDQVTGFDVHWSHRKSHVCLAPFGNCELCDRGLSKRWVGYLAAMNSSKAKRFLVEFTALVMPGLTRMREQRGTLRGLAVRLTRPSHTPNGHLKIDFHGHGLDVPVGECPPPFDLELVLGKIYGLAIDEPVQEDPPANHAEAVTKFLDRATNPVAVDQPTPPASLADLESRLQQFSKNGQH